MSRLIFSDDYNSTVNPLESKVPDTGTGYTKEEDTTTGATGARSVKVDSANAYVRVTTSTNSAGVLYSCQPNPGVADYDVEAIAYISSQDADDSQYVFGRMVDTDNMYAMVSYGASSTADKKLYKIVAGVVTELASGDSDFTTGDFMKLELRGTAIKGYCDNNSGGYQLILSAVDSSFTAPGKAGLGWGNKFIVTNDAVSTARFDKIFITQQDVTINVSETITITESITVFFPTLNINVSDTITITETVAVVDPNSTKIVSVSESITVSESVTMLRTLFINKSETITVSTSVTMNLVTPPHRSRFMTCT